MYVVLRFASILVLRVETNMPNMHMDRSLGTCISENSRLEPENTLETCWVSTLSISRY